MEQQERSKMLGTMPMGRLVTKVSVPIMVSMLVQALYNVVDGIFVARYSPDALTAVSLAFPVQLLMIAVATGLGVGINSLISRKLGQKRPDEARGAARCGMLLELGGFVLFLLFGLLGSRSFFHVFTPDAELQRMAGDYLSIVTIFSFGLFLSISFERMMQATGNTMLSMTTQLTGAVINIILDPIMIFGYFGFPELGVSGAAIATVLGQILSMVYALWVVLTGDHAVKITLRGFRPKGRIIRDIYAVGFPSIIMHLTKDEPVPQREGEARVVVKNNDWASVLMTMAVAVVCGVLGKLSGVPVGTLLFSMLGVIAFKLVVGRAAVPMWLKRVAQVLSGAYIGSSLGLEDLMDMRVLIIPILLLVLAYACNCFLLGGILHRFCGFTRRESMLIATPAGASDMALISSDLDIHNPDLIVLQIVRMVLVISVFPQIINLVVGVLG